MVSLEELTPRAFVPAPMAGRFRRPGEYYSRLSILTLHGDLP
jgi:hypothetical protein